MISRQLQISSIQNYYDGFDSTDDSEMLQNKDTYCEEIIYGIILSSTNMLLQYNDISYYKNMYRKKPAFKTEYVYINSFL